MDAKYKGFTVYLWEKLSSFTCFTASFSFTASFRTSDRAFPHCVGIHFPKRLKET